LNYRSICGIIVLVIDVEFVIVSEENIADAARIHSEAWKQSHEAFCSAEFVAAHTPERQRLYLQDEIQAGKRVWMLTDGEPVGIVSVQGSMIENLYVTPDKQRRGYGSALLDHAVKQCDGRPVLNVLNINDGACRLYLRAGFVETGMVRQLNDSLWEIEMALKR